MTCEENEKSLKIAILGWGSLLWEEHTDFDKHHNEWRLDGPTLKLEFSRVSRSRNGALTLVLDQQNGALCDVGYAFSTRKNVDNAIFDLKCREGTTLKNIGFYYADGSRKHSREEATLESINKWMSEKNIDVVIWTDLASNFQRKSESMKEFSTESALAHLQSLGAVGKARAVEYVWRAPEFVRTPLRDALEKQPWFQKRA